MKTIWKYPLETNDTLDILMPKNSKILTVQMQNGIPCLWVLVDDSKENERRTFALHGTGHEVNHTDIKKYIGTFQMMKGTLVVHVFEILI